MRNVTERQALLVCPACGNTHHFLGKALYHVDRVNRFMDVVRVDSAEYEFFACCECGEEFNPETPVADECLNRDG
jgi:hypothetical protein